MNHQPPQTTWVYTTPPPIPVSTVHPTPPHSHLDIHVEYPNGAHQPQNIQSSHIMLVPPELIRAWGILGILTAFLLLGFLIGIIYERTNESPRMSEAHISHLA